MGGTSMCWRRRHNLLVSFIHRIFLQVLFGNFFEQLWCHKSWAWNSWTLEDYLHVNEKQKKREKIPGGDYCCMERFLASWTDPQCWLLRVPSQSQTISPVLGDQSRLGINCYPKAQHVCCLFKRHKSDVLYHFLAPNVNFIAKSSVTWYRFLCFPFFQHKRIILTFCAKS